MVSIPQKLALRIQELESENAALKRSGASAVLQAKDREIDVLTQERDNALLRIEELDRDIARPYDFWVTRGGVNPNA